ncbi:MAG: phosphotransferase family protein [Gaiellaceae bacterium]
MSATAATPRLPSLDRDASRSAQPLWEYVGQSGLQSLVACASKNPNAKFTVLLVSPATRRIVHAVKVPTTDIAAAAIEAEAQMLLELQRATTRVAGTIPRLVDLVEFGGRVGIVMTAVTGTPMTTSYLRSRHTARPAAVAADFAAVDAWLTDFQNGTSGTTAAVDMDAGVAAGLSARFADHAALAEALDRLAQIHASLRTNVVPRTAVHGDLWFGNVLVSGTRASGIVDWEAGELAGEPLRDLARFAHMYALFLDRRTRRGRTVAGHRGLRAGDWGAGVAFAVDGTGWFPELFRRFLRDGLARLGASPAHWRDLALAGVAEVAGLADEDEYARHHLELFLELSRAAPTQGGDR